jgi:hypothetical protein
MTDEYRTFGGLKIGKRNRKYWVEICLSTSFRQSQISHDLPGVEPEPPVGKPASNRLSYAKDYWWESQRERDH